MLTEIISLVEWLGYSAIEVTVQEWASEVFERGLVGLFAGGIVGAAAESGLLAVAATLVGSAFGALSGAEARKLKAGYEGRRNHRGNWSFRERPRTDHMLPSTAGVPIWPASA